MIVNTEGIKIVRHFVVVVSPYEPGFAAEKLISAKYEAQNAVRAAVINPQSSLIFRRPQLLIYKSYLSRNFSSLSLEPS